MSTSGAPAHAGTGAAPQVEVVIEVPRGSFLKRGSSGRIDFVSPLPCPFNYGAVPDRIGLDGDLLDALVLGPRLAYGTRLRIAARGAVGLTDRNLYDDKLVCSRLPLGPAEIATVVRFFHFYALCKRLLNRWRGRPGRTYCNGWGDAGAAIARSSARGSVWTGPRVPF